jgi:hypothetical protein
MREYWSIFSQQFKPRLHEISAYLIALSFCWLLIFHPEFRHGFYMFFSGFGSMSPFFIALGLIVTGGLLLSLIHVFTRRKKSATEKFLIGWFVLGTCSVVSFVLASEMLLLRSPIVIILPAWNIVMSVVLLFQMAASKYDLLDEDASFREVIISTALLVVILSFSDLYLHLSWAMSLSFCIFYSTSIVFLVIRMIHRNRS